MKFTQQQQQVQGQKLNLFDLSVFFFQNSNNEKVPLFLSCKLMKVIFWRLVVIIIVLGLSCCSILLFRAGRSSQQRTLPTWSSPTFINLYKYIWQFGKIHVRCHFWTNFKENWSPNLQNWKKNIFIKLNFFLIAKVHFQLGQIQTNQIQCTTLNNFAQLVTDLNYTTREPSTIPNRKLQLVHNNHKTVIACKSCEANSVGRENFQGVAGWTEALLFKSLLYCTLHSMYTLPTVWSSPKELLSCFAGPQKIWSFEAWL